MPEVLSAKDEQAKLCEAAIHHAAEAIKEAARSMAPRRSGAHARRDLESAAIHLREATRYATEAFYAVSE